MRQVDAAKGHRVAASAVFMDTLVSIEVIDPVSDDECRDHIEAAFGWFREVERQCSRFDVDSDLSRLSATPVGQPARTTPLVFRLVEFALAVADASGGAFDPTVGRLMEVSGFDRNFRTGEQVQGRADVASDCSYRDVRIAPDPDTVTLLRPLVLDLGAVAKGFAIDLAAEALDPYPNYAINAGGDVFVRGRNSLHALWRIGIRHPRDDESLIDVLQVSDRAVCTSGDYERQRPDGNRGHHIIAPGKGASAAGTASVTVVAPSAMVADALSTAAFVMPPERAIDFLERQGVEGLIVSPDLVRHETPGMAEYRLGALV